MKTTASNHNLQSIYSRNFDAKLRKNKFKRVANFSIQNICSVYRIGMNLVAMQHLSCAILVLNRQSLLAHSGLFCQYR